MLKLFAPPPCRLSLVEAVFFPPIWLQPRDSETDRFSRVFQKFDVRRCGQGVGTFEESRQRKTKEKSNELRGRERVVRAGWQLLLGEFHWFHVISLDEIYGLRGEEVESSVMVISRERSLGPTRFAWERPHGPKIDRRPPRQTDAITRG